MRQVTPPAANAVFNASIQPQARTGTLKNA